MLTVVRLVDVRIDDGVVDADGGDRHSGDGGQRSSREAARREFRQIQPIQPRGRLRDGRSGRKPHNS